MTASSDTPAAVARIRAATYTVPRWTPSKKRFSESRVNVQEYKRLPAPTASSPATPQHHPTRQMKRDPRTPERHNNDRKTTTVASSVSRARSQRMLDVYVPTTHSPNNDPTIYSQTPSTIHSASSSAKRKRSLSRRRDLQKFTVLRDHGTPLQLTAAQLEIYNGPPTPVIGEDAFLPSPWRLFRYVVQGAGVRTF